MMSIWQTFKSYVRERRVLSSCTAEREPILKTQQYTTAEQKLLKKGVQCLFPLCSRGTPKHNQTNCLLRGGAVSLHNYVALSVFSIISSQNFSSFFPYKFLLKTITLNFTMRPLFVCLKIIQSPLKSL